MSTNLAPLTLPDLGLADVPVVASMWLVEQGAAVTVGDRLLEVLADGSTIDLSAPASGIVRELLVTEEDRLEPGQLLAWIEVADDDEP